MPAYLIHFNTVSPFVLLIVLMASPLVGVLVATILSQSPRINVRLRSLAEPLTIVGVGLALVAAWLLGGQTGWEVVLGNWSPISFTGLPLAIADFAPAAGVIIAWTTVSFLDNLLRSSEEAQRGSQAAAPALLVASLAIVGFANNAITLLVGLGLTDLVGAYWALRRQDNPREAMIGLMLNGLSLTLVALVFAVQAAAGNSLHFPLVRLDESAAPALALAIVLRLNFAPFRPSPNVWGNPRTAASAVGGLLLLARLPTLGITRLPDWFYALAVIGALLTLIIAILQAEARSDGLVPAIATAGAYLAGVSAILTTPGVTAAATMAWLIGATLIGYPKPTDAMPQIERVARRIRQITGALCLIGLPLTVGFVGRAGVATALTERGLIGLLFLAGWGVSSALMTYALARIIFDSTEGHGNKEQIALEDSYLGPWTAREIIGGATAVVPILLFGMAPGLLGVESLANALGRNGIAGWVSGFVPVAVGVLLWRLEPYWRQATQPIGERVGNALGLGAFYDLLNGAVARLRHPFSQVFNLLEGDGALLWTIILVLLIVLISRPGGP